MPQLIEFETGRLRLRQWRLSDRQPFAELNADPRVMEHFPATLERTASDAMADRCASLIAERGWGLWAAEDRTTGEFIGFIGLHVPVPALPFSPCVEVGWRLAFAHWGKGYATEGAMGAFDVGFNMLGLAEILSFTTVRNFRSRAVMERLGMQRVPGTFDHPALVAGSPLAAHCLYRVSCERWAAHH
jgi:RimJ/RimL family protein N-acetyltransferase